MTNVRDLFDRVAAQDQADLARAEGEAHASGKQAFDLARFEQLLNRGSQATRELARRTQYYVQHPELKSLAEFVALLHEIEPWEDSP